MVYQQQFDGCQWFCVDGNVEGNAMGEVKVNYGDGKGSAEVVSDYREREPPTLPITLNDVGGGRRKI